MTTPVFAYTRDQWEQQMRNSRRAALVDEMREVVAEAETAIRALCQLRRDGLDLPCRMGDPLRNAGNKLAVLDAMWGAS